MKDIKEAWPKLSPDVQRELKSNIGSLSTDAFVALTHAGRTFAFAHFVGTEPTGAPNLEPEEWEWIALQA
ncbi:hypothetical protein [Plantibacter sp. VKM Ac-2876]|uniref:hypothetical protein n=1 Tax=Plantibacter sp. VKM Ac-2876 TaxID=2783826 RepID=UPI00188BF861|nr:hypothetical protein [Plantibacter sp. VKM Ac-2876]MBF4565407.1 hypothetical protein [Plantibacter sp. VKM Ac-2876]